ncbi:hypothetical protein N7462_003820 [Penicillium macrosclerotiorum]|uniref:uncharacterized protein n=1 Tax=Penicillium macrosclerotiorum TaxID=303699 RepID=UPI00254813C2|nr:uncharacterized protein N7462_003820 [Penicillium macrosclerotiorum]KAJ5689428.1 hypothetical protein N7462_003820 [Penicillium macrosclerotiorum]
MASKRKTYMPNKPTETPYFLKLPAELRLKIYGYALTVPNDYVNKPLIVVNDRGNVFTVRGRYRALSMCPSWVGEDGTTRKLLAVNRQIHDEAEVYLYSQHTLFFRNSFNLDRLGDFLDTLSITARHCICSVGFEVFFFVHAQNGVPKRSLKQYARASTLLAQKLPHWRSTLFYLDPRFYYPTTAVGGRERAAYGVAELATHYGALCKELTFYPLPASDYHLLDQARQTVWRSSSPGRRAAAEGGRFAKYSALDSNKHHPAADSAKMLLLSSADQPTASWSW